MNEPHNIAESPPERIVADILDTLQKLRAQGLLVDISSSALSKPVVFYTMEIKVFETPDAKTMWIEGNYDAAGLTLFMGSVSFEYDTDYGYSELVALSDGLAKLIVYPPVEF